MNNMDEKAVELYKSGFSCSESIIRAAYQCKAINKSTDIETLTRIASSFSGGMGESGCLCGAVAGAQIILGMNFGRKDSSVRASEIKAISKSFIEKFKEKEKVTCCKALTAKYDFGSPERKSHCANIVKNTALLLSDHIKENLESLSKA